MIDSGGLGARGAGHGGGDGGRGVGDHFSYQSQLGKLQHTNSTPRVLVCGMRRTLFVTLRQRALIRQRFTFEHTRCKSKHKAIRLQSLNDRIRRTATPPRETSVSRVGWDMRSRGYRSTLTCWVRKHRVTSSHAHWNQSNDLVPSRDSRD